MTQIRDLYCSKAERSPSAGDAEARSCVWLQTADDAQVTSDEASEETTDSR